MLVYTATVYAQYARLPHALSPPSPVIPPFHNSPTVSFFGVHPPTLYPVAQAHIRGITTCSLLFGLVRRVLRVSTALSIARASPPAAAATLAGRPRTTTNPVP